MTKTKDIICPYCGKKDTWTPENKFKPFCSERCKMVDLGDWAAEKYRVAGEKAESDRSDEDED